MEFEEEDVSDGSDIEVEEDLNYLLEEENSLEEVRDQRVFNESEDIVRNIFASDSDSDEEFAGFQNAWYTNNGGHGGFIPRNTQPYRRHRGLTADTQQRLPSEPKAVDFFLCFWTSTMWQRLVQETARYASQQRTANPPPPSSKWQDPSVDEMKTFVGLSMMMGILRLPCRNDYWRVQERCWLAHTNFGKAMPRDRFNLIWRYLHLQNTEPNPTGDRCIKIRWFINYLVGRYQAVYTPGKNISFLLFTTPSLLLDLILCHPHPQAKEN